jgi:F0F1-type ATP synthase assembly protein I
MDMDVVNHSIIMLNKLEDKEPPGNLFEQVNTKIKFKERTLSIQLVSAIFIALIITALVIHILGSSPTELSLETYFSTNYNLYGYE